MGGKSAWQGPLAPHVKKLAALAARKHQGQSKCARLGGAVRPGLALALQRSLCGPAPHAQFQQTVSCEMKQLMLMSLCRSHGLSKKPRGEESLLNRFGMGIEDVCRFCLSTRALALLAHPHPCVLGVELLLPRGRWVPSTPKWWEHKRASARGGAYLQLIRVPYGPAMISCTHSPSEEETIFFWGTQSERSVVSWG